MPRWGVPLSTIWDFTSAILHQARFIRRKINSLCSAGTPCAIVMLPLCYRRLDKKRGPIEKHLAYIIRVNAPMITLTTIQKLQRLFTDGSPGPLRTGLRHSTKDPCCNGEKRWKKAHLILLTEHIAHLRVAGFPPETIPWLLLVHIAQAATASAVNPSTLQFGPCKFP